MIEARSTKRLTRQEWDEAAPRFRDLSYCQCGSYAEAAASQVGAAADFMACFRATELVGLATIRVKAIPLLPVGIAYVHYGPLTAHSDEFSAELFGCCIDALRQEYVENRRLVLRIVPPLRGGRWLENHAACLEMRGFRRSDRYKAQETFILDLARPLEEIRRNFDAKWRSDLSKAERLDIEITRSDEAADLSRFEPMFLDLVQQKHFSASQDVAFFRRVQEGANPPERVTTHLAWHEGELIAGHIGSFVGETAVYLLGASTTKGRELRASYLLQWAAIEHAKSIGNLYYDLGGIDQRANPDVYRFKKRLNGRRVEEIGAYELAPNQVAGRVLYFLEDSYSVLSPLRKRARRLRNALRLN
jgi:hypothetical protein